jgi:hypothetical protein
VLFQPRLWWQLFTVFALASLLGAWKRARLAEWILFAGFFYIFWRANKNFGYFVMAAFPMIAAGLDRTGRMIRDALSRKGADGRNTQEPSQAPPFWLGGCALACLVLIPMAFSGWLYDLAWTPVQRGTSFNKSVLPLEACDFIKEKGIEGRLLNSWSHGGYIAWATGQKVFIYSHGEVMGPAFYDEYVDSKQPQGFEAALAKWKPTVVVVPFKLSPYWLYHLNQAKDWRMVLATEHTALFLHASVAPHVPSLPKPQAGVEYPVFEDAVSERLIREAASADPAGPWAWLQGSGAYPNREMTLSAFYLQTGKVDACIGLCLEGLRKTSFLVPDLMLNLGHALNARRRYELADLCFDAFLRVDSDPVIAQEITHVRRARR